MSCLENSIHPLCSENFTITDSINSSAVDEKAFHWTWPVLLAVVPPGSLGNMAVLWIIATVDQFRRPTNYLLANLSLTSLLMMGSFLSVTLQKSRPLLSYSPWICRLFPAVHMAPIAVEGFTVMQISLDRTRVVRHPLKGETKASALKKIAFLWGIGIGIMLLYGTLFWNYDESTKDFLKCSDRDQSAYGSPWPYIFFLVTSSFVVYLLPSIVILRDLLLLSCQLRYLLTCQAPSEDTTGYHARRKDLIRNAILFTVIFLMFKVPSGILIPLERLPQWVLPDSIIHWICQWRRYFYCLVIFHGSFYPIIFFSLSTDLRQFVCRCCCLARPRPQPAFVMQS